jgi:hypothetical protein
MRTQRQTAAAQVAPTWSERMNLEQVLARWARHEGEAPATNRLSGRWTNQYGSVAELAVDEGKVSGTFTSAVGAEDGLVGEVVGHASGDIVAFSVRWPAHTRSLTSYVGQVVDDGGAPALRTLWHLIVDIPDEAEPTRLWTTIHSGADTFR